MAFGDKHNVAVVEGDMVFYDGAVHFIRSFQSHPLATVAVIEDISTHSISFPLLRDIVKL